METIRLTTRIWADLVYSEDEGVWYAQLFGRGGSDLGETATHKTREGALKEALQLAASVQVN
jgi:hypothetical protein